MVTSDRLMRPHEGARTALTWRGAMLALVALGCSRPQDGVAQVDTALTLQPNDPAAQAAWTALAAGRPWEATRLLTPVLTDSSRRAPETVLVAAIAAARWGGWTRVEQLLAGQPWLESAFEGRGAELLTRAALERGADSLARTLAERALVSARAPAHRGARLVLLARALDRLALGDTAAATYERAAELLPETRDWLTLRAAGATRDRGKRQSLYRDIRLGVAQGRVAVSEAQALARWGGGDADDAARMFDSLGMAGRALRARLDAARDSAARAALRPTALALLERESPRLPGDAAREVIDVIDRAFTPLGAAEEVVVARAAGAAGMNQRAVSGFARADGSQSLGSRDRVAWAQALVRTGSFREAAAQFAKVPASDPLGAEAAYGRGRALVRARSFTGARAAFRDVLARHPGDTAAAAGSLFLLADLATDEARDDAARESYRSLATRYPSSPFAPTALLRAGVIAFAHRQDRAAIEAFDAVVRGYPSSDEVLAASYWGGRSAARIGNRADAQRRWRDVLQREPVSYYAMLSAKRLGERLPIPEAGGDSSARDAVADSAVRRTLALDGLGMDVERDHEVNALIDEAGRAPERRYPIAEALARAGRPWFAVRLARGALQRGAARDARLVRLMHPVAFRELIARESKARKLDPALVSALILQESGFNPNATSSAGAMGLMQVLPDVGRSIAAGRGYPFWDRSLLYAPEVSIDLGTAHLAEMLGGYPHLAYALAAYNAGGSPVGRWRSKPGTDDPELFVERIPYDETRDYVRILLRDRDVYARLYTW